MLQSGRCELFKQLNEIKFFLVRLRASGVITRRGPLEPHAMICRNLSRTGLLRKANLWQHPTARAQQLELDKGKRA